MLSNAIGDDRSRSNSTRLPSGRRRLSSKRVLRKLRSQCDRRASELSSQVDPAGGGERDGDGPVVAPANDNRADVSVGHDAAVTGGHPSILERPVYGVSEAAGVLGMRADRVRAWLDGYERQGHRYPPVIRPEQTGVDMVTWGEFVELGYLREYRRKGVPLQRLRPVILELREVLGTPYPLATKRPYVHGKELVLAAQERADLPASVAIVIRSGQQILLTDEPSRFFKKVEFGDGLEALRLRPLGDTSPVVIDPLVRFGRPSVDGVATERLWELHDAGEPIAEIADGYDLDVDVVRAAVSYEEQLRLLAA